MSEPNFDWILSDELVLVAKADPADIKFVKRGAIVWLRSGSPPLKVRSIHKGMAMVKWKAGNIGGQHSFPVACLTPEPTPIKS